MKITGSAVSTATANDFIGGIAVQIGSEIRGGDQNSYISGSSTANHANTFAFGIVVRGGSSITLGAGNDTLVGTANIGSGRAFGIGNIGVLGGSIFTGEGNDKVISQATVGGQMVDGFFGGIEIDLGAGNDTLSGFGNAKVDGGSGTDTLDLSQYALATFTISKDAVTQAVVLAKAGGATMHLAHFESFVFSDGVFSFATLPASTFG